MKLKFIAQKKPIDVEIYEFEGTQDIETKEGLAYSVSGKTHYIVRGIQGELWPLDKGIFNQTYDIKEKTIRTFHTWQTVKPHQLPKWIRNRGHGKHNLRRFNYKVCKHCGIISNVAYYGGYMEYIHEINYNNRKHEYWYKEDGVIKTYYKAGDVICERSKYLFDETGEILKKVGLNKDHRLNPLSSKEIKKERDEEFK